VKIQDVILRAMAKRITWWQAAQILGISDRSMRRWKGATRNTVMTDRSTGGRGKASPKRVPLEQAQEVLRLYHRPDQ
jgi:hypothetical protein